MIWKLGSEYVGLYYGRICLISLARSFPQPPLPCYPVLTCSSPTMMGSDFPLDAEAAKRPVHDPIAELRYISERKSIVCF